MNLRFPSNRGQKQQVLSPTPQTVVFKLDGAVHALQQVLVVPSANGGKPGATRVAEEGQVTESLHPLT